jgi:hypothetical protein
MTENLYIASCFDAFLEESNYLANSNSNAI